MANFNFSKYTFLAKGGNNECYYKNNVVAKIFSKKDSVYSPEREAEYHHKANQINELAVQYQGLRYFDNCTILFMDLLIPMKREDFTRKERKQMIAVFEQQLLELHSQGVYHLDIKTPYGTFSNVILTKEGIRLIDWGRSHEIHAYGLKLVYRKEWENFYAFCDWFLEPDYIKLVEEDQIEEEEEEDHQTIDVDKLFSTYLDVEEDDYYMRKWYLGSVHLLPSKPEWWDYCTWKKRVSYVMSFDIELIRKELDAYSNSSYCAQSIEESNELFD